MRLCGPLMALASYWRSVLSCSPGAHGRTRIGPPRTAAIDRSVGIRQESQRNLQARECLRVTAHDTLPGSSGERQVGHLSGARAISTTSPTPAASP